MHVFIIFFFFFKRGFKYKARETRYVAEENMGLDNLAYGQRRRLPDNELKMKVMELSQPEEQPYDGDYLDIPIDPEDCFLTPDNTNERPDNLRFSGVVASQSEVQILFK